SLYAGELIERIGAHRQEFEAAVSLSSTAECRRRCARGATHRTSDGATVLNVYSGHSPVSIQEATSLDGLRLRQRVGLLRQAGEPPIDALLLLGRKEMRV